MPWHTHTNVSDTFYVLEGQMRLFLQQPKEEVNLKPGEVHVVKPARPHLVTNGGTKSLTFLVLQGVGEYDFVPLLPSKVDVSGTRHGFRLRSPSYGGQVACPTLIAHESTTPRATGMLWSQPQDARPEVDPPAPPVGL